MDPVFTLQWPEFLITQRFQSFFPKAHGYSLLVPVSRQEKAIDLAIIKKGCGSHTTVTIQIKASRTYLHPPPKREETKRFRYETWFSRFAVPEEADFFVLLGLYGPDTGKTARVSAKWYRDCSLLLTRMEMSDLMETCLTVGGKRDRMFGFGFDEPGSVFLTRGDSARSFKDFSNCLLDRRIGLVRSALNRSNGQSVG